MEWLRGSGSTFNLDYWAVIGVDGVERGTGTLGCVVGVCVRLTGIDGDGGSFRARCRKVATLLYALEMSWS